jgi:hypothetical protein
VNLPSHFLKEFKVECPICMTKVKSARAYFYYSVFVERKDVEKIAIGHAKNRHLPIAFLQYTVRVRSWPRLLTSDGADELIETKLHSGT